MQQVAAHLLPHAAVLHKGLNQSIAGLRMPRVPVICAWGMSHITLHGQIVAAALMLLDWQPAP